jgi:hypothetical protein
VLPQGRFGRKWVGVGYLREGIASVTSCFLIVEADSGIRGYMLQMTVVRTEQNLQSIL